MVSRHSGRARLRPSRMAPWLGGTLAPGPLKDFPKGTAAFLPDPLRSSRHRRAFAAPSPNAWADDKPLLRHR